MNINIINNAMLEIKYYYSFFVVVVVMVFIDLQLGNINRLKYFLVSFLCPGYWQKTNGINNKNKTCVYRKSIILSIIVECNRPLAIVGNYTRLKNNSNYYDSSILNTYYYSISMNSNNTTKVTLK